MAAGYPYFFAVILLHPQRVGLGQLAYGLAAIAVGLPFVAKDAHAQAVGNQGTYPANGFRLTPGCGGQKPRSRPAP